MKTSCIGHCCDNIRVTVAPHENLFKQKFEKDTAFFLGFVFRVNEDLNEYLLNCDEMSLISLNFNPVYDHRN